MQSIANTVAHSFPQLTVDRRDTNKSRRREPVSRSRLQEQALTRPVLLS